jgi:hypothetical protein
MAYLMAESKTLWINNFGCDWQNNERRFMRVLNILISRRLICNTCRQDGPKARRKTKISRIFCVTIANFQFNIFLKARQFLGICLKFLLLKKCAFTGKFIVSLKLKCWIYEHTLFCKQLNCMLHDRQYNTQNSCWNVGFGGRWHIFRPDTSAESSKRVKIVKKIF